MLIGICSVSTYTDSCGPDIPHVISSTHFSSLKKEPNMQLTQCMAALWMAALVASGLAFNGNAMAQNDQAGAAVNQGAQPEAGAKQEFKIIRVTPEFWRVTIDHPPFNIFGPESIPQLNSVVTQIENDPGLKVVVFDSAVPGFFLTHYDFVPPLEATTRLPPGPTGLPPLPDMLTRLPRLMVRGRALEILLSGNDINGELAERYGYVNRALPDSELDKFVDTLARRIASFDKQTIGEIKHFVNIATLPPNSEIGPQWDAFITSVQRPAAQRDIKKLMELGLQKKPDVEIHLDQYTGEVNQPSK